MPSVLVTGGAGYIGSHACKALAEAGFTPVTYDNLVYGHPWAVKWGPFEQGDTRDEATLGDVLERHRPVAVMHFAAFAYVGESVSRPDRYYGNNVAGTLGLLDGMVKAGIDKLVFSSSCATYGMPGTDLITEAQPQNPINPYGRSKLMVEQILGDYDHAFALRSLSLRYFNAAGADPDGEIGEDHDPETHLIPLVLAAAAGRRPSITIFGNDYGTPDGTCIRDYIHVSDLARAHVAALTHLLDGHPTGAYNLGTGSGVSVREVIDTARRVTERDIAIEEGPRRPGDPDRLVADPELAFRGLGWRARYTSIEDTVASAWRWHSRHWGLSRSPAS